MPLSFRDELLQPPGDDDVISDDDDVSDDVLPGEASSHSHARSAQRKRASARVVSEQFVLRSPRMRDMR